MTGFSSRSTQLSFNNTSVQITLTLKSLNSRFFETNCKLPYSLTSLETELIKIFKTYLIRGSIFFTVHLSNPSVFKSAVMPSLTMVHNYLTALDEIQKKFNLPGQLSITDVVNLPHIFEIPEQIPTPETMQAFMELIKQLVNDLVKVRQEEGAALQNDLEACLHKMHQCITELEPRALHMIEQKKEALLQQLKALQEAITALPEKEQPLALIASQLDKLTIHEEIFRFKTHLKKFEEILASSEQEKGKQLDFTLQELLREANTMLAKSIDAHVSALAIALKVEIEKAREQVQNIV